MNFMLCLQGEPEDMKYLHEIKKLGVGIELESYGIIGVQSEENWNKRFQQHQIVVDNFYGKIALHGPFIGMDYTNIDYMIRKVVEQRFDMTFEVATKLKVQKVILHSGCGPEIELFKLENSWLKKAVNFWKNEIKRWENEKITVVLENDTQKTPEIIIKLLDEINNPYFKFCFDIGHQNVFSSISLNKWIELIKDRLNHVHLHDNDGIIDQHLSIGKGKINFDNFFEIIDKLNLSPTISLETQDKTEIKFSDLKKIITMFSK